MAAILGIFPPGEIRFGRRLFIGNISSRNFVANFETEQLRGYQSSVVAVHRRALGQISREIKQPCVFAGQFLAAKWAQFAKFPLSIVRLSSRDRFCKVLLLVFTSERLFGKSNERIRLFFIKKEVFREFYLELAASVSAASANDAQDYQWLQSAEEVLR